MPKKDPNRHEFQELVILEHLLKKGSATRSELAKELFLEEKKIKMKKLPKLNSYKSSIIQRVIDRMINEEYIKSDFVPKGFTIKGRYQLTGFGKSVIQSKLNLQKKLQEDFSIKDLKEDLHQTFYEYDDDLLAITFLIRNKEVVQTICKLEKNKELLKEKFGSIVSSIDVTLRYDQYETDDKMREIYDPNLQSEITELQKEVRRLKTELKKYN